MCRAIALLTTFLLGIGQNLPYDNLYVHGIGMGDGLLLLCFAFAILYAPYRQEVIQVAFDLRSLAVLVFMFVGFTLLSSLMNSYVWGISGHDVVEIFRPIYYLVLVIFVVLWVRHYGISSLIIAFLLGILTAGIFAYWNASGAGAAGLPVVWNSNVIGNLLAIGVSLASLLILQRNYFFAFLFVASFSFLAVFTHSKGTWIMMLLGLTACILAVFSKLHVARNEDSGSPAIFLIGISIGVAIAVVNYDLLYELFKFKIATTQIGDTAMEGGTVAARYGFLVASVRLALENPVLGVGISNYAIAYDSLQALLGSNYWETDNPHSAWLYVLACIGFPALLVFLLIVVHALSAMYQIVPLARPGAKMLFTLCLAGTFFLSGSLLLALLTQHFFWFFVGLVFGWKFRLIGCQSGPQQKVSRMVEI